MSLLNFPWKAQDNLWELIARGGIEIADMERSVAERCRTLLSKYKDLSMDLADAALVAASETRKIKSIVTLDHKDFSVYRPSHVKRLELIRVRLFCDDGLMGPCRSLRESIHSRSCALSGHRNGSNRRPKRAAPIAVHALILLLALRHGLHQ